MDLASWLGSAFAVATVVWGVGGTLYTNRVLRPLREVTARGQHQLDLARSSPDLFTKKVFLSKAQTTVSGQREKVLRFKRWHDRVYTPGVVVLALGTVVCALWEVTT